MVFFMEFARFLSLFYFGNYFIYFIYFIYFVYLIYFIYLISLGISFGGASLGSGPYYFFVGAFELFGGILFCEFLG